MFFYPPKRRRDQLKGTAFEYSEILNKISFSHMIKPEALLSRVFDPLVLRFITSKTHTAILRRKLLKSHWSPMAP